MARSSRRRDAGVPQVVKSRSDEDGDGDGASDETPSVVIEPPKALGAGSVDDLRDRLVDLQSTVEQLVAQAKAAPADLSGDPEVDRSARTLRFAQQTADSVVAEAREEAAAIVADAERQRSEIIRRARQQADQDYSTERDLVEGSSAAWQAQRAEVLDQLDGLVEVFAAYREGLEHLDTTVRSVADRLRDGTIAEPIVVGATVTDLTEAAEGAEEPEGAEVSDAAIDLTDAATEDDLAADTPVETGVRRNPFTRRVVSHLAAIEADKDPFVFDVAELPETTGDFGWETDEPAGSGSAPDADPDDGAVTF